MLPELLSSVLGRMLITGVIVSRMIFAEMVKPRQYSALAGSLVMKVLIVDDSRLMRTMNQRGLVKAGDVVFVVGDCAMGIMAARECTPRRNHVRHDARSKIAGVELLYRVRKEDKISFLCQFRF